MTNPPPPHDSNALGQVNLADPVDLVDSTDLLDDPRALRARADEDGYLFFRALLPREAVLEVRRDVLTAIAADGWLDDAAPLEQGRLDHRAIDTIPDDELRDDIGVSEQGYVHIQQVESLHRLPHHPALLSLYDDLIDGSVFVHPRHIVRAMTSHRGLSPTPAHQDFPLVQGTGATWTCWAPLGDCPRSLGSLAVLPGTHRRGYRPVIEAPGAGHIGAQLCDDDLPRWHGADFAAGDVLTFNAYTVHRSLPALDRDHLRLSMDVRYQSTDDPIEARALTNHADVDWATVYQGWGDTTFQRYWLDADLTIEPWDDALIQPSRRIC